MAAGVWIVSRATRNPSRRIELVVFAAAVASNAVGGLLEHGTGWSGARWVHDVAIVAVLGFIAAFGVARALDRGTAWTMRAYGIVMTVSGALLAAVPDAAYGLFVVAGAGAVGGELVEYRHEVPALRREGITARRAARLGVTLVLLLAGTAFWVGRSGAVLCNPQSPFQWHAVWHVLAALAMALYAHGAIEPRPSALSRPVGV